MVKFMMGLLLLVGAHAHAELNADIEAVFKVFSHQRPVVPMATRKEMQSKFFVMYPGGGGINPWVFQDNIRTLVEDYGVDRAQILIRDVEAAYRGQKGNRTQMETAFLRGLAHEQHKPLVLIAHSAHGADLFATLLTMPEEIFPGGVIDRAVFIECNLRTQFPNRAMHAYPGLLAESKNKIFLVGYWEEGGPRAIHRGPGPGGLGTFLGGLRGDHVDTVMPVRHNAHEPWEYREAFTHILLGRIY